MQGTDEYLWDKLANDKTLLAGNPDLARVVAERDRSKIDYSLIKTDTNGRVTEYTFKTELGPAHPDYVPKDPQVEVFESSEAQSISMTMPSVLRPVAGRLLDVEGLRVRVSRLFPESHQVFRRSVDQSLTVRITPAGTDLAKSGRVERGAWLTFAAHLR
ncbi:hypothetical protein [Nocardia higoensis]|uniref:hypothetical protein n=1 Tax=Nocardia higoensis TaxID=228599 RepID=UPI0012F62E1E|nr:hypothetical protein [Nocardia higoensis]